MELLPGNNQIAHIASQNQPAFSIERNSEGMFNGRPTGGEGNGMLNSGFGMGNIFASGRATDVIKKPKKGPPSYPAAYIYKLDEWMDLYQDSWVRVRMKRLKLFNYKSRIMGHINLMVENKSLSLLSKVAVKIKNNPPSKLL
jgi:hypothetical protein